MSISQASQQPQASTVPVHSKLACMRQTCNGCGGGLSLQVQLRALVRGARRLSISDCHCSNRRALALPQQRQASQVSKAANLMQRLDVLYSALRLLRVLMPPHVNPILLQGQGHQRMCTT